MPAAHGTAATLWLVIELVDEVGVVLFTEDRIQIAVTAL